MGTLALESAYRVLCVGYDGHCKVVTSYTGQTATIEISELLIHNHRREENLVRIFT